MSILSGAVPRHADAYEGCCRAAFAMASIDVDSEVIRRAAITVARLGTVLGQPEPRFSIDVDFGSMLEKTA